MGNYTSGKDAYGISDRSGFRYRLRDMRTEWNGMKVGPDEYEPKHPQLEPRRRVIDPQALKDPRPENNSIPVTASFPAFNLESLTFELVPKLTATLGEVTVNAPTTVSVNTPVTGFALTSSLGTASTTGTTITQTFAVTVQSYLGANKYYIDGVRQATVTLTEGNTYRFDQSDSSNSGHPLRLSATSDGTHGGGSQYTTGVTTTSTYTQITVAVGAPTLYYYCTNHSGMGGQANTP
tara:strand:+ start:2064 stop:2771 length:708 start_codon:yes stop_codon:yes gene_type:complete